MRLAAMMSGDLERENREVFRGFKLIPQYAEAHTLEELFTAYHMAKETEWGEVHRGSQYLFRDFWLDKLGGDTLLHDVNGHSVETLSKKRPGGLESRRKLLSYIKAAFSYASIKLKWIDPRDTLSHLDMPKSKPASKSYTQQEVFALVRALETLGPAPGWLGHVAWQSGRRLTAMRTLLRSAVETFDDHTVLTFPGDTDKSKNTGEVIVVGMAHELTVSLMTDVSSAGNHHVLGDPPPTKERCVRQWLPAAEKIAGIEHVSGRAYHGIKRRFATASRGMVGRDKQAGTLEATLEGKYVQDDRDPKKAVAEALAEMVEGT